MDMDRNTAFAVLLDIEKSEAFSNLALNRRIAENQPQNQAFVRELVYCVLKYRCQEAKKTGFDTAAHGHVSAYLYG